MTPSTTRRAFASSALLGAAMLAAACGAASPGAGPTAGTTPASASATPGTVAPSARSASPSASASASQSPPASAAAAFTGCTPDQLRATVDTSQSSGAAGSIYFPLDFVNVSSRSCTMYGYPGVSFVTGPSGSQIGRAAARDPVVPATTVTLAPGATAHATLQVAEAGNYAASQCRPVTAHWLKIYPPDQYSAVFTRFTDLVCSAKLPAKLGSQLHITVIEPGAGKAGQP